MERKFKFLENNFYHIYNRGVDKRKIFSSSNDYKRFLLLLYLSNTTEHYHLSTLLRQKSYSELFKQKIKNPLVSIGAYCLMPNHFHILITPLVEKGVEKFMLKLQTGYSMYYNQKNERTGSLFQGTYKAKQVLNDEYLKYLYSYIHLNPAKIFDNDWKTNLKNNRILLKKIKEYLYSSFQEYRSNNFLICQPKKFPEYFNTIKKVEDMVDFWIQNNNIEVVGKSE